MATDSLSWRRLVLPIRLGIDPMEGLLIANFKGDPEFEGIEPQIFDDPVNGRGMRVLRYRKDGMVDVYWQPGVRVDRGTFTVGKGIGDFAETTMEPALLKITGRGIYLNVAFTDAQGRKVELRVLEEAPGKHGFPLLAPVGASIKKPRQLFLVYMPSIDLVRRTGTYLRRAALPGAGQSGSQEFSSPEDHTAHRAEVTTPPSSLMSLKNGNLHVCLSAWSSSREWYVCFGPGQHLTAGGALSISAKLRLCREHGSEKEANK